MEFDPFLLRVALAAVGTAVAASLLGCFVIWRRMVYFGDATAHAAVLGVAISLGLSISIVWGVLAMALAMALALGALESRGSEVNSSLGVMAHGALAIGLVGIALAPGGTGVNLEIYLFGDVLAVSWSDTAMIWVGAAIVAAILWWYWQSLLISTLNPDLAIASGVRPERQKLILAILLAVVIAVAIRVVGALLITALLIIPATTARALGRTPEAMALWSVVAGISAALLGLWGALATDAPVGPSIVCAAVLLFVVSLARKVP